MSIKLQLRRGLEVNLPSLAEGEPGFCADTYKLFIGSAAGNRGVAMLASPVFTGLVTLPGIRVPLGDAKNNLGIGTGALASINPVFTMNDTVIGVGALSSDQWIGFNTVYGAGALPILEDGYANDVFGCGAGLALKRGARDCLFGGSAGGYLIDGCDDVVIGQNAFHSAHASRCVIIGSSSAHDGCGDGCDFIGYKAGYYETGSNKLFIDNDRRASEADGRIKALIYGIFDALTANQRLSFNARVLVRECPNYANNTAALAGGLVSGEFYTVTGTDPLQVAKVI